MKIIRYSEARALGLQLYYTGKPCKNGHIAQRFTSSATCKACSDETNARFKARNPLAGTYAHMIDRCTNEESPDYANYGGRGITVCDRWLDAETGYSAFCTDMAEKPVGFSLDRIDNDGNYEPGNCRWADSVTQTRNQRHTKIKGEDLPDIFEMLDAGMTYSKIAVRYGCDQSNIYHIRRNRELYIEAGLDCRPKAAAG